MVLINGTRRYRASTTYVDNKVLLTDIDTGVKFYLPVVIAYSYKVLRHTLSTQQKDYNDKRTPEAIFKVCEWIRENK